MQGILSENTSVAATAPAPPPMLRDLRDTDQEKTRTLMVVSNRGPYEHHWDEKAGLRAVRGQGGMITALTGVAERQRVNWVAAAITPVDRQIATQELPLPLSRLQGGRLRLKLVAVEPNVYQNYYNTFSNPFLWFLQHGIKQTGLRMSAITHAWQTGYVPVNRTMAHAAWEELRRLGASPVIMLHDYHLYLVAGHLRSWLPHAVIQHFVHIPWPGPDSWERLTAPIRSSILAGLLANDIVGLQTRRDVRNFLSTVGAFVPEAAIDQEKATIHNGARTTLVRAYPISVDVAKLRREVRSPEVSSYAKNLASLVGERTIVRVDRLDPSKNILRGFEAFDLLLGRRPDLLGKIRFLSFLVPSRTSIPAYRGYEQKALEAARKLNQRYGTADWSPVEVFHENNYYQALAAMQLYDVLLVNPVADGMNLVSKEGPIVNDRDGVLVLSRAAGSYEQLADGALGVDPLDTLQTSVALESALDMPHQERSRRASLLRHEVEREDLSLWLDSQLGDIEKHASLGAGTRLRASFAGSGLTRENAVLGGSNHD